MASNFCFTGINVGSITNSFTVVYDNLGVNGVEFFILISGAEYQNRTDDLNLEGSRFTPKLIPQGYLFLCLSRS